MDNQSSPAQLLFPTVPSNYCPQGNWSDIFNSFISLYLNNGTIDIPFLNQITPQQINTLSQTLLTITNKINAIEYQTGVASVQLATTAGSPFVSYTTVTFPTPINNTNYYIGGYFYIPATGVQSSYGCSYQIVSGSQTTTGFGLRFSNESLDISQFKWHVFNIGALSTTTQQ